MTGVALLPPGVRKEIRALWPVWAACAAAIVAGGFLDGINTVTAAVFAYALGSVALGAQSIGHEYTNRTLTQLLSLPADRRRLYLVKLGVLIPMLLSLGALAFVLLFNPRTLDHGPAATFPLVSVMCALFLAPWLTMICRGPLAGIVFALVIPGMIFVAGDVAGFSAYGLGPEAARLKFAVFWWGMTGSCAVAAVLSWRMFMRLEAMEGRDPHVRLPRWLRDPAAATDVELARHPVWLLVKKELRLQHLTFVVSGIYLLEWATLWVLRLMAPGLEGTPFAVATAFHSGAAALLAGSLASAEERHFGTLEPQLLLPMATWKQWTVKAGTTFGVVLLLAVALPALLGRFSPSGDGLRVNGWFAAAMILLMAASLYVSSLCASGLRALLASVAVMVSVVIAGSALYSVIGSNVYRTILSILSASQTDVPRSWAEPLAIALAAGFLALVLRFALVNHRSSERRVGRVGWQAARMVAWLIVAFVILVACLAGDYRLASVRTV